MTSRRLLFGERLIERLRHIFAKIIAGFHAQLGDGVADLRCFYGPHARFPCDELPVGWDESTELQPFLHRWRFSSGDDSGDLPCPARISRYASVSSANNT